MISKNSTIYLFILTYTLLFLSGCLNIENIKYSKEWPEILPIENLSDIAGLYVNHGVGDGACLWGYLTNKYSREKDATIRISVPELTSLRVDFIHQNKTLTTALLHLGSDFKLKNGIILLPSEAGFESGGLGSGGGVEFHRIYLTQDSSLAGVRRGVAAGLALHVIPMIGFGAKWTFWNKIEEAQQENSPLTLKPAAPL